MTALVVRSAPNGGDEGKGKIVDIFTEHADMVVRYGGGPNAGHTLVVGDQKLVVRLIPSGILRPRTTCVLAQGMAIDPAGSRHGARRARAPRPRAARRVADRERPRARDPALPRARRHAARADLRRARDDQARRGPLLRGQGGPPRPAARRAARPRARRARRGARARELGADDPGARRGRAVGRRGDGSAAPAGRAHRAAARRDVRAGRARGARRQARPLRGRAGDAARHRPRDVPVRHVVARDGGRRLHGRGRGPVAHRPRRGPREGLLHARRRRPVPDGAQPTRRASAFANGATSSDP